MDNEHKIQPDKIKFERRRFKRISRNYIVSYAPLEEGKELKSDVSQTKNLSEGGLLFIANKAFEKDVILRIKLRLPDLLDYVIVKAQVVASRKLVKDVMYEIRAEFIDIEQNIIDAIRGLADYE